MSATELEPKELFMKCQHVRWQLWIPLFIITLTVLAYLNAFGNAFIFDDEQIIVNNPEIRQLWPVGMAARWVVNLTFKLNYATGQLRVADYHATNLLIHLLAALVLYGIVRRTLTLPRVGEIWKRHGALLAGAVAALWAVHPLQTQSVTYICQRYESLMGLCYLATLYAFVRGAQTRGRYAAAAWYGLSVVVCLLGMGTKEIMITAPLVVLLYDLLVASPSARVAIRQRGLVHVGLWLTVAVFALTEWQMFSVIEQRGEGVTLAVSSWSYLLTQMQVIPYYLRLSLVPYPLCLDYGWSFASSWTESIASGLLLVGLGVLTVWLWVRRRPEAFIGLWFFCILAPTSSVVPVPDAIFEHRMYLPLAAVLVALVLGAYRLLYRDMSTVRAVRVAGIGVVVVLVGVGAVMTHQRNRVYRSALTMWEDVVGTRPQNRRARLNYSSALLTAGRTTESRQEAGVVASQLAYCAELKPEEVPAWGQTPEEAALYRDARHYAIAHNYMGVICIQKGGERAAESHFAEAVRLLPQFEDAARNLRRVRKQTKEKPRRSGALPLD